MPFLRRNASYFRLTTKADSALEGNKHLAVGAFGYVNGRRHRNRVARSEALRGSAKGVVLA